MKPPPSMRHTSCSVSTTGLCSSLPSAPSSYQHSVLPRRQAYPRVNKYDNQYILSVAERLYTLEWLIIVMDQHFPMLPGLFDPARDVFYLRRNIQDIILPNADTFIAAIVESWAQYRGASALNPLREDRQPFETTADVQCDMKRALRDILAIPKRIHHRGTQGYKTADLRNLDKLGSSLILRGPT